MSERDLEAIVVEILASSASAQNQPEAVAANVQSGNSRSGTGRPAGDRRKAYVARPRQRRSLRNPLRTSLRVIFVGLVVLCVPLLFL